MVNYELHEYAGCPIRAQVVGPRKDVREGITRDNQPIFSTVPITRPACRRSGRDPRVKSRPRGGKRGITRAPTGHDRRCRMKDYTRDAAQFIPLSLALPPPAPSLPPFVPPSTKLNQWHNSLAGCTVNRYRAAVKAAIY